MLSLKSKIRFIEEYAQENYKGWFNKQPENIVGVRVGKFHDGGSRGRYKIIFHVVKKLRPEQILPEQRLPDWITIKFPDNRVRKVQTAVQETGKFQFHFNVGTPINNYTSGEAGSTGPFLTDGAIAYLCTNFHVAAWHLMLQGQLFFNVDNGDGPANLDVDRIECSLAFGSFGDTVDLGLIEVGHPADFNNLLPDGNLIDNKTIISPQAFSGAAFAYCPRTHASGYSINIVSIDTYFNTLFKDISIEHVITADLFSQHGDSGSPVVDGKYRLLGLVAGGDNLFTYIIPFTAIDNFITKYFKSLNII